MDPQQEADDLVVHVLAFRAGALSFTARGLLVHLMGSGEDRHNLAELVEQSGTTRGELLRAIRELEDAALVRLAHAASPGPRLAAVTPHRAQPADVVATEEEPPPDASAVTEAGIALAREALQAALRTARDRGAISRHDRRPYVPPWQVPRDRPPTEASTEDQGDVTAVDDVKPQA